MHLYGPDTGNRQGGKVFFYKGTVYLDQIQGDSLNGLLDFLQTGADKDADCFDGCWDGLGQVTGLLQGHLTLTFGKDKADEICPFRNSPSDGFLGRKTAYFNPCQSATP